MATDIASRATTFANTTRNAHRKRVEQSVNKELWLFNNLKADPQKHAGEARVDFSLQTALGEGASFTSAGAAHPSAVQPAFAKGYLYIKKLISLFKYNEEVVHLDKGEESIIRELLRLRQDTTDVYNILKEFSLYTPSNGVLATATSEDSGQTFTVDSVRWLRVGMVIDGYDASNNHDADSVVITNINPSTLTVTVTGTITSVDTNTNFYYNDTYTASGGDIQTNKYTNGIQTICSDVDPTYGDFLGLDRDTYEYAKAITKYGSTPGTNEAFTFDRLFGLLDLQQTAVGLNKLPTLAICDPKCFRAIYNTYVDQHQPTVFMPTKDGMPDRLEFKYGSHTIGIVSAHRAAPNKLLLPNTKYVIKYSGGPEGWDTYAGGIRWIEGYQQFEEIYRGWWNYGTDFPQSHSALFDITGA